MQLHRFSALMICLMAMLGSTLITSQARADEEEAPAPSFSATGETTVTWSYDKDALTAAFTAALAGEEYEGVEITIADADEDEGTPRTAKAFGTVTIGYPDGSSEERKAIYSMGEGEEIAVQVLSWANYVVDNLWILIAAALVFLMHLGFATLEAGLTRSKETVNILFKNTMIPCIGLVMYAVCGWLIMYPSDWIVDGVFAFGFGLGYGDASIDNSPLYVGEAYTLNADFIFQGMFAATAATIVSGAVAGRIALAPFLLFTTLFVGVSYPITGSWQWGGGWLDALGFYDFAGSTLVHAVGGTGALIGAIILGPRLGKYAADGSINPIPGHNLPLAAIGVFLLWLGWFGFNGGSVLSADPSLVSLVFVTTGIAAACGCIAAGVISWIAGGKPDLTMALNGVLAGLVGITAGADLMSWVDAAIIGLIAGGIVYYSVLAFDKIKIDDPVGAISVHLVCGIWGTLAVGIFGSNAGTGQLVNQAIGCFSIIAFTAVSASILFLAIKAVFGLRVSADEEIEGLDLGEHDMSAYPDFQRVYIKSYHAREM